MRPQNLYQAETVQMLGHGDPSVTLKRPILALYREMPGQGPVALTGQEVDAVMGGQVVECLWFAMLVQVLERCTRHQGGHRDRACDRC